ncbi:MAG TPA: hypothetical protein VJG90_08435 [Candidatus Nanoarchaeia archaeon]|nr:hypothetical protein [Candidatus Nanoarchaeia archaeon]
MSTIRETTADFLLMLKAEMTKWPTMQGILLFGSYVRGGQFNDVDIVTVLAGNMELERLKTASESDRRQFEDFLIQGETQFRIPPFQNQGYFGVRISTPRIPNDELAQLERSVQGFYDFYLRFNRLEGSTRIEYGIDKPPADFRFSPMDLIWKEEKVGDTVVKEGCVGLLERLNKELEPEIKAYAVTV